MTYRLLLTIITVVTFSFCQAQELSAEKKKSDSLSAIKHRKEDPAVYRNNVAPVLLDDKTCFVNGHQTSLRISNEGYGDSVRRNYHPTMPGEESNVVPLASFVVGGEKIKVQFRLNSLLFGGGKNQSGETHIATTAEMEADKETLNKNKAFKAHNDSINSHYFVRISINNQPLFQWRPINSFASILYKSSQSFTINKKVSFYGYEDFYDFLDTTLAINDQLFIEIKDDKTGWMMDSYNITRKEMSPKVSLVLPNDTTTLLAEKKTSF